MSTGGPTFSSLPPPPFLGQRLELLECRGGRGSGWAGALFPLPPPPEPPLPWSQLLPPLPSIRPTRVLAWDFHRALEKEVLRGLGPCKAAYL